MKRALLLAFALLLVAAPARAWRLSGPWNTTLSPHEAETITGEWVFSAGMDVKNGATSAGFIDLFEDSDDGTSYIRFIAPALSGNVVLTLPTTDGNAGQFLKTDGSGTLSWGDGYGYITLIGPHAAGSGVTAMDTTATNEYYGQALFANATDKATNYVEYRCVVPYDIDTSGDLSAYFKFRLGGADTADHQYYISMVSVADSGDYTGTVASEIALGYTADGSGADGDVETATADTLTNWKSNVTAGQLWVIRVARDGDDGTNDASTTDSYTGPLTIKYLKN